MSLTFFVNLYAIYVLENPAPHPPFPQAAPELRYVVSLINLALLGYTLFLGRQGPQREWPARVRSLPQGEVEMNRSRKALDAGQARDQREMPQ